MGVEEQRKETKKSARLKTKNEGLEPTAYYDPTEECDVDQIPCRITLMILPWHGIIYVLENPPIESTR